MKVPFASLFQENTDRSITALVRVRVGGITIEPNTSLVPGTSIGGVDLTLYKGREFEIVIENEVSVIKGIYSTSQGA